MQPDPNPTKKRCLITGSSAGIGKVAALELGKMGMEVVLVGRNLEKTTQVAQQIVAVGGQAEVIIADLSSLKNVQAAALEFKERFDRLDILVNNAGAFFGKRTPTIDGLEATFALNHLAYFGLTLELLPLMPAGSRIVSTASDAHRTGHMRWHDLQMVEGYTSFFAYAQSKLANILFTRELARRVQARGITVHCLHPGAVRTDIWRSNTLIDHLAKLGERFLISPEEGAKTLIYLASSADVPKGTGKYFALERVVTPSPRALDDAAGLRLWDVSEELYRFHTRYNSNP